MLIQQIFNGLSLGSTYVLLAVAFTLAIGVLNFLNFSLPGIFMLAAVAFWASASSGHPFLVAFALALVVGGLCSLIVEHSTYRWMHGADHFVPLVSSMAFLILFENLALLRWGSDLQVVPKLLPELSVRAGHLTIGLPQLAGLAIALTFVGALNYMLRSTKGGRGIRAIAESPETAAILGLPVFRLVPLVYVAAGLLAALAGVIFAVNYQQVHPMMGEEVAFKAVSAMVIGGMGSVWGAVVGGLFVGLTEVLAIHWFGANVVDICVYGLLLLILILRPEGLFGAAAIKREKF